MPSLLSKVQDARKFLAHYPSFFFLENPLSSIFSLFGRLFVRRMHLKLEYVGFIAPIILVLALLVSTEVLADVQKKQMPVNKTSLQKALKLSGGPRKIGRRIIDPNSPEQKKAFEKKMRNAANLYEKQFLREMVRAMRSTVSYSKYSKPTMAEKIYKDKMYENYVNKWSQKGGVGFSEVIYKQMLEKYSPYHRPKSYFTGGTMAISKKPMIPMKGNVVKGNKSLSLVEEKDQ